MVCACLEMNKPLATVDTVRGERVNIHTIYYNKPLATVDAVRREKVNIHPIYLNKPLATVDAVRREKVTLPNKRSIYTFAVDIHIPMPFPSGISYLLS